MVVYATLVHEVFDGADTFFPALSAEEWVLNFDSIELYEPDSKNKYGYTFRTYERL